MLMRKLENKMAIESAALLQYNVSQVLRRDIVNENYPLCTYLHLALANTKNLPPLVTCLLNALLRAHPPAPGDADDSLAVVFVGILKLRKMQVYYEIFRAPNRACSKTLSRQNKEQNSWCFRSQLIRMISKSVTRYRL